MSESFATLLDESLETLDMKQGSIVSGVVLDVDKDWVTVHVGLKSEGIISLDEFRDNDGNTDINVGDDVEVALEAVEDGYGETRISREKARKISTWKMLEDALESGEFVTGKIHNRVKGGFSVEVEVVKAFLPGSLVDVRPLKEAPDIENTVQEFKVIKLDYKRNNVVLSRKAVLEKNNSAVKIELLKNLDEGQIIKGVVKNITDYGAFVDLGGVDGLLHVTDIAWKRINHPSEALQVGQTVDVQVIRFNAETQRISLGMKQLLSDPWSDAAEKFVVGSKLSGRVTNITDYGAFVELDEGVEGLVHVSEMSWTKKNVHPGKIVSTSQQIDVMVLDVDMVKRRISLGLKQTTANPWEEFKDTFQVGAEIEAEIRNITEFGIFVGLTEEIDGLVHMSDISWEKTGEAALESYNKGDQIKAKILEIDLDKERISLGIKQLSDDPYVGEIEKIKKGSVVTCTIAAIADGGLEVRVGDHLNGFIRKADLSRERSEQRTERFAVDEKIDAVVTQFDKKTRNLSLSIKAREIAEEKRAMADYGSSDSGASLGDILGAALAKKDDGGTADSDG